MFVPPYCLNVILMGGGGDVALYSRHDEQYKITFLSKSSNMLVLGTYIVASPMSQCVWVLPPWAAATAMPDVDTASGKYDDTFSLYDPWADSNRHEAWRQVELQPGDWIFMPVGWWHVVRASIGSVMLNFRMPRGGV